MDSEYWGNQKKGKVSAHFLFEKIKNKEIIRVTLFPEKGTMLHGKKVKRETSFEGEPNLLDALLNHLLENTKMKSFTQEKNIINISLSNDYLVEYHIKNKKIIEMTVLQGGVK
jgi:hypothetical protein